MGFSTGSPSPVGLHATKKSKPLRRKRPITPRTLPVILARIRRAILPYPKAMLFELRDQGYGSVFEQLCACLISIRTLDEVSLPSALKLFQFAREASAMEHLDIDTIHAYIRPATFSRQKAERIKTIARIVVEELGGVIPCASDALTALPGIGPKCANLVLGIACGQPAIGVDIHVHRVTNRWGYVEEKAPERTLAALERKLPRKYWVELNELLVPFGKHICTGRRPKCSSCPVLEFCQQKGVFYWR